MNPYIYALQILNILVLIILGLFLRSYLPSYFRKKGENRASKEDIEEISGKDEGIRSAVGEIKVGREEYLSERRGSLLKFYDLSIVLYYEKLAIDFGDFTGEDNGRMLVDYEKSFYETITELIKSYQRIVVYFEDKELVRVNAEILLLQVLKTRSVMKKHFGKIKISFIDLVNDFDSGMEPFRKANSEFWNEMNPIMTGLVDALRLYLTELNKFLRPGELPSIPWLEN